MDFQLNLCRICLKSDTSKSFLSIFPNRNEIAVQIALISTVKINEAAIICQKCLKKLKDAIKLRNDCIKAEKHFKSLFGGESIDPEKEIKLPKKRYQCTTCSKFFSCLYYLKQHEIALHTKLNPDDFFECDSCDYTSKTKPLMRAHQNNYHCNKEEKRMAKYQCRYCGRISLSVGALYSHEKTHREIPLEEYLKCKLCNKLFKEKRLLKNHIQLVHEKSLKRQCTHKDCGFIATCVGSLKKHVNAVHLKIKDYFCDEDACNRRFGNNQQLLRHKRSHRGQKPFKCLNESCEKFFADAHGRKRHLNICSYSNKRI